MNSSRMKCSGMIALLLSAIGHVAIAQEQALTPVRLGGDTFLVHPDYQLAKVADEKVVSRPVVADWDDQGRLIVVESAGAVGTAEEQRESLPHQLVRLSDTDHDGVFDRREIIAKDLGFYSGVLWTEQGIYVSTPPSILKLTDPNQDGFFESQEVWHDGGTITYCANDLHGPYRGPDGWIYWTKGAFADQVNLDANGKELQSTAAHLLRKKDGDSFAEIVASGGMDNPVELAFLNNGDLFFTSTFLQHPADGKRDGIAHAVDGGVFGKRHRVLDTLTMTGDVLPVMTHLGPAAPSGLMRWKSIGSAHDVLVCAQFNLHQVFAHELIPSGATYSTEDSVLMRSPRLDFHPTDVIEDQDGSILILDTGDWYDLCCPSSGIEGQRSQGGIYRLVKKQTNSNSEPNLHEIDWDRMSLPNALAMLDGSNPLLTQHASDWIVLQDDAGMAIRNKFYEEDSSLALKQRLVWLASRLSEQIANGMLVDFLGSSKEPKLQQTILNASHRKLSLDQNQVFRLLRSSDPMVQRSAAEYLAVHPTADAVAMLLEVIEAKPDPDPFWWHAMVRSLMTCARTDQLLDELRGDKSAITFACLTALSQRPDVTLKAKDVMPIVLSDQLEAAKLAAKIAGKEIAWADNSLDEVVKEFRERSSAGTSSEALLVLMRSWSETEKAREVCAQLIENEVNSNNVSIFVHLANATFASDWDAGIAKWVNDASNAERLQLFQFLKDQELNRKSNPLTVSAIVAAANDDQLEQRSRLAAASALPTAMKPEEHYLSRWLVELVLSTDEPQLQIEAANVIRKQQLDGAAVSLLIENLDRVSVLTSDAILENLISRDETTAEELLEVLAETKTALLVDGNRLLEMYRRYPALKEDVAEVVAAISRPPVEVAEALDTIEDRLPKGDPIRGMQVFHGSEAACGVCHRVGYVGGDIGPELTRIGATRTRRALLEAVVFPSLHVAQGYRSETIITESGRVITGLVKRESSQQLIIITGLNREETVQLDEVESRNPSDISIMPKGLDQSLAPQQFADLLEFLTQTGK